MKLEDFRLVLIDPETSSRITFTLEDVRGLRLHTLDQDISLSITDIHPALRPSDISERIELAVVLAGKT